jgi:hypothetical protein
MSLIGTVTRARLFLVELKALDGSLSLSSAFGLESASQAFLKISVRQVGSRV